MSLKVLMVSDLHLTDSAVACRKDDVFDTQIKLLTDLYEIANEEGCEYILQAGDVLDKPRVSNRVLTGFIDLIKANSQRWVVIPGQHDLKNHNYNSWTSESDLALIGTLTNKFTVLHAGKSHVLSEELKVRVTGYGYDEPATQDFMYGGPSLLGDDTGYKEIALVHASVCDGGSPFWQDIKDLTYLKDYAYAHFGDIHKGFPETTIGKTKCFNGGVLSPMKSNEAQCPYIVIVTFEDDGSHSHKIVRLLDDWTIMRDDSSKAVDVSFLDKASDDFLQVMGDAKSRANEDPTILLHEIAQTNTINAAIVKTASEYLTEAMKDA